MAHPIPTLVAGIAFFLVLYLYDCICPIDQNLLRGAFKKWRLPPGPRGIPVLGNLLMLKDVADETKTRKFLTNLASYGEMTTLHLGSRTWVLLNSNRVAQEIIAKRGNVTTERNEMPVASGLVSRRMRSLLLPTKEWLEPRRLMHHLLSGSALKQYGEWQTLESTQMVAEYLYHPDLWYSHHYRYANSVVHRIALGERIEASSENLANLQRLVAEFVGSIGSSIVDWFPVLNRLPPFLQPWRGHWAKIGQFHNDVYHEWWDPTRKAVEEGTAPPSWARDVLLNPASKYTGNEEEAMYCAMELVEAGSDTTREALNIFVMAMIKHPEVLVRLREEIDRICDTQQGLRLPQMEDMESMPFVCGTIKEVLRWRPIFPLTPEHSLSQPLEFEGYRFPAGVSFVLNGIAVADDCDDPSAFKPARWLDGNETNVTHGLWQFGGGRRICVGYRLAQRGLFLNIARLAMCFDFTARGEIDSERLNNHTTGEPFGVDVKLRHEQYRELIEQSAESAGVLEQARRRRKAAPTYTFHREMVF